MKLLLKAKKSLGQNFLIDKNIIKKIIEIGNINKNKIIMEIGPGYGDLTRNIVVLKKTINFRNYHVNPSLFGLIRIMRALWEKYAIKEIENNYFH